MKTSGTIQEFVEEITKVIRKLSPEEKREFREAWLAQCDRSALKLTGADVRWLKELKINPSGD